MKKFLCALFCVWGIAALCPASGIADEAEKGKEKADMSYAFGMIVAADIVESGLEFNYDAFARGFREMMEKEDTRYTVDEAAEIISAAFAAAQAALGEKNRAEGTAFLAENEKRPGVIVTPSGLQYEVLEEGSGETPGPADSVLVQYEGTFIDGTVFDTTYSGDAPAEIPLNRVIPGWAEGLRAMKEGGRAKLYIPPELAYGDRGAGAIGPNSVLIFEVELLIIVPPPENEDAAAGEDAAASD